jgi:hypothetical protein
VSGWQRAIELAEKRADRLAVRSKGIDFVGMGRA